MPPTDVLFILHLKVRGEEHRLVIPAKEYVEALRWTSSRLDAFRAVKDGVEWAYTRVYKRARMGRARKERT